MDMNIKDVMLGSYKWFKQYNVLVQKRLYSIDSSTCKLNIQA